MKSTYLQLLVRHQPVNLVYQCLASEQEINAQISNYLD
jgi:hypothetical protein